MISGKSDITDLKVTVHYETPKAWLVSNDKKKEVWLPKSMVEMDTKFKTYAPVAGIVTLPEWLAEREGLV